MTTPAQREAVARTLAEIAEHNAEQWRAWLPRADEIIAAYEAAAPVRPLSDWHEDDYDVLWWRFPIEEPPYVGSPLDSDWPGYHTHFTPPPAPPKDLAHD